MITITKEFTKEQLQQIIETDHVQCGEASSLARTALASLEAEAVGEVVLGEYDDCGCHPDARVACIAADGQADWENFKDGTRLYTAPPAPVVPEEATPENIEILASTFAPRGVTYQWDRDECNAAADSWNACRAAMLHGADGNSPVIPGCSCLTCRPLTFSDSRFVVCPECGNKRCPHANDHRNACTGSNEPGQEGSAYPAAPQQEVESQIRKGKTVAMEEWELGARLTKHRFKP